MPLPDLERLGFLLTDEQRSIRDAMIRFAEDRLAPGAADRDKTGGFPSKLIAELASLGGMAMKVSPADDGPGLDNKSYAFAIEAIARSDASVAVVMVAANLAASILGKHSTEEQRERFLRPLARGERGAPAFALTEPHAGSDAAAITTRARKDGDAWVLDGAKQWITGAAAAEVFTVFAKTPTDKNRSAATCFMAERVRIFTAEQPAWASSQEQISSHSGFPE